MTNNRCVALVGMLLAANMATCQIAEAFQEEPGFSAMFRVINLQNAT